jgi:peptidoglycan/LPS O-acetylase OafA/YrhL
MSVDTPIRPVRGRHARVATPPPQAAYKPAFDGLRTIAVYLVLAFHAGWGLFGNGYIGVDIFFVLSGFLITGLLLREYRTTGQIRLMRFYARRIRRLLPASLVVLTLGLGATLLVTGPLYRDLVVKDAQAAMLWVANWHLINTGNDYFSPEHTSPFVHFWSLAVEEQFYLVFPGLILGVFAYAGRKRLRREGLLILATGALIALSIGLAFMIGANDQIRSYYGTETRVYQLLAGALLALLVTTEPRGYSKLFWIRAQWIAVAMIAFLAIGPADLALATRGVLVAAATVLLILALDILPTGPFAQLLSRPAMTSLGRISYGTYLWHMPVLYILIATIDPAPIPLTFATALIATGLAWLSARFIETPIRKSAYLEARPGLVVVVGIGMSLVLALSVLPRIAGGDSTPPLRTSHGSDLASIDWVSVREDKGTAPVCNGDNVQQCVLVDNGDDAMSINVIGDSHARTMIPALTELAKEQRWTLSATVIGGCPWQWGVVYPPEITDNYAKCPAIQDDWYQTVLPALSPDVTLMVSAAFTDPVAKFNIQAARQEDASRTQEDLVSVSSRRAVDAVRATGSQVVLMEPLPIARKNFNPLECLSEGGTVQDCSFTSEPKDEWVLKAQDELVNDYDDVWQIGFNDLVCPDLPVCEPFFDGTVVRRDNNHVTGTFWVQHKAQILEALKGTSPDSAVAKAANRGSNV